MLTDNPVLHERLHSDLLLAPIVSSVRPSTGARVGERRLDPTTGVEYYYSGTAWVPLGLMRFDTWANRPSSPYTDQHYFATDRNMEFVYNGTKWVSAQVFEMALSPDQNRPVATGTVTNTVFCSLRGASAIPSMVSGNGGIQVNQLTLNLMPNTAQTATNYIDWQWLFTNTAGGVSSALSVTGSPANTQGQGAGAWKGYQFLNANLDIIDASFSSVVVNLLIRGTTPLATNVYAAASLAFRLYGA